MDTVSFENKRWASLVQREEFRHRAALSLVKGTVLDVGCGDGLLLEGLQKQGQVSVGVDLSEAAVKICTEKGFDVRRIDGEHKLPFEAGSFDTVVALDVLEHLYEPEILLSELHRVARTYVVVGVPNFSSLAARVQVLFGFVPENNRPHKGHVYWFTWSVLRSLVEKQNFGIEVLKTNTLWERVPVLSFGMRTLAHLFPGVFALSFVVRLKKGYE